MVASTGMVPGAIQIPPDGAPIVLLVDHATLGGYPVLACVISADLARLGQLRPGDRLTFSPVDAAAARSAHERRRRALAGSVSGWFPTVTGT
jgi:allophanate hydrolase subunit 2